MPKKQRDWYTVSLRLPRGLADDVKRHVEKLRKDNMDGTVTEQNVYRALIRRGLEAT